MVVSGGRLIFPSFFKAPVSSARYGRGDDDISIDFHYNHPKQGEGEGNPTDTAEAEQKSTEGSCGIQAGLHTDSVLTIMYGY